MLVQEASPTLLRAPVARVQHVAMISVHTSPLALLGGNDAGGLTVYVMELSKQLISRGVAVDIFTRRTDTTTPEIVQINENLRVITIEAGPTAPVHKDDLFCFLADFASEMALFSMREGIRYDILHSHYWLSGWVAHLLQRYQSIPTVHMFHTLAQLKNLASDEHHQESPLRLQIEDRLLKQLDVIIAPNPDEKAELVWGSGASSSMVRLIPPGVDLARYHPSDSALARKLLELPDDPLVLFVGRIDPIKDIPTLLKSFKILKTFPELTSTKLLIVGGSIQADGDTVSYGDGLGAVVSMAESLGVAEDLLLTGAQPQEKLPEFYAAADVCVVPSRYESFGLVAVEAMACGVPVVATRVGGMKFTVEEGISGLLVPPGNPEAMAIAISRVLANERMRSMLQVGARQASIRFSWHTIGSAVLQMYEQLVDGQPGWIAEPDAIYAS